MKIFAILVLWLAAAGSSLGDDTSVVGQVQRILNPGSRFNLYELQPDGSYGARKLTGRYLAVSGNQTFVIHDLVDAHDLVVEVGQNGRIQARVERIQAEGDGSPLKVLLSDGTFDLTEQSLEGRVKAELGVPQTIVFGVRWELSSPDFGPDKVEYTLAFRTNTSGPISTFHYVHDLKGTPLETPRQAAADVAAGGLLADAGSLSFAVLSVAASKPEERAHLLPRLQPLMDSTILQMDELTGLTSSASPVVERRARSALAEMKSLVGILQKLRDSKLVASYLSPSDQTRVEAILNSWAVTGIPFSAPHKP